jgi:hypothetical protein
MFTLCFGGNIAERINNEDAKPGKCREWDMMWKTTVEAWMKCCKKQKRREEKINIIQDLVGFPSLLSPPPFQSVFCNLYIKELYLRPKYYMSYPKLACCSNHFLLY